MPAYILNSPYSGKLNYQNTITRKFASSLGQ